MNFKVGYDTIRPVSMQLMFICVCVCSTNGPIRSGYNFIVEKCAISKQIAECVLMRLFVHCVPKNWTTNLIAVTLSNLNRFSKFFHC